MKSNNVRKTMFCFIQRCFLQTSSSSSASPLSPLPTTTSTTSSSSSFTVQFLVDSCGLTLTSALSVSQKHQINPNKLQNSQSVLHLFKSHHFSDSDIAKVIQKKPEFLRYSVDDNLTPKMELLVENGFLGQLLHQLIASNPIILARALDSLKHALEFLKSVLGGDDKLVAAITRSPWLLLADVKSILQPNVDLLIKEGVPFDRVAKLILKSPRAIQVKHDRMVYAVNSVKSLGFHPEDAMFTHALVVKISMKELSWKKKFEIMKSLGWSEEELLVAFKRNPYILSCSEERIKRAMDFFVNTLKWRAQTIVARPEFFNYSIDRRLRPRHNVLEILVSKKLIRENEKNAGALILMNEDDFLDRYVNKYADKVPGLLEIYCGTCKAKKRDA